MVFALRSALHTGLHTGFSAIRHLTHRSSCPVSVKSLVTRSPQFPWRWGAKAVSFSSLKGPLPTSKAHLTFQLKPGAQEIGSFENRSTVAKKKFLVIEKGVIPKAIEKPEDMSKMSEAEKRKVYDDEIQNKLAISRALEGIKDLFDCLHGTKISLNVGFRQEGPEIPYYQLIFRTSILRYGFTLEKGPKAQIFKDFLVTEQTIPEIMDIIDTCRLRDIQVTIHKNET